MAKSCADKLKVLADATRLAVLEALLERPQYVGDLAAALDVEQTLLSHHLSVLREAGLVESERDGKSVLYRIAPGVEGATAGKAISLGCCRISFEPAPLRSRSRSS